MGGCFGCLHLSVIIRLFCSKYAAEKDILSYPTLTFLPLYCKVSWKDATQHKTITLLQSTIICSRRFHKITLTRALQPSPYLDLNITVNRDVNVYFEIVHCTGAQVPRGTRNDAITTAFYPFPITWIHNNAHLPLSHNP